MHKIMSSDVACQCRWNKRESGSEGPQSRDTPKHSTTALSCTTRVAAGPCRWNKRNSGTEGPQSRDTPNHSATSVSCIRMVKAGPCRWNKRESVWYGRAAEQGDAEAQCNLAVMHENGEGGPVSLEHAIFWIKWESYKYRL